MDSELQRKYIPERDTRLVILKDQIKQLRRQIDQVKTGTGNGATGAIPLSSMLSLHSEYTSFKTDVQVEQAILLARK
jgi:hypothetical protein